MKLTSENVEKVFFDCLFKDGENTNNAKKIKGIMSNFGFNPERIEKNKDNIYLMLNELPDGFKKNKGGGQSFLNACEDKNGDQWTGMYNIME